MQTRKVRGNDLFLEETTTAVRTQSVSVGASHQPPARAL